MIGSQSRCFQRAERPQYRPTRLLRIPPARGFPVPPDGVPSVPSQASQRLAHRADADAQTLGDLALGMSVGLETLDHRSTRGRQAHTPTRTVPGLSQGRQDPLLEPSLIAPHGAHRVAKDASHIVLIRPTLLDQAHHGLSLRHALAHRILRQGYPRHEDHPVIALGAELAPIVDELSRRRVLNVRKEVILPHGIHTVTG